MRSRAEKHGDRMRLQQLNTRARWEREQATTLERAAELAAEDQAKAAARTRAAKAKRRRSVTMLDCQRRMDFVTERLEAKHPLDAVLADQVIISYVREHGRVHSSWLNDTFRAMGLHPQTYASRFSALLNRNILAGTGEYLRANDPAAGNPNKQLQVWKAGPLLRAWERTNGVVTDATLDWVADLLDYSLEDDAE